MELTKTSFRDLFVFQPKIFSDQRGYFFESFNQKRFHDLTGLSAQFVQDNQSLSAKYVLRGLHLQVPPYTQAKLVRVVAGSVLDVVLDLRRAEPTFGKHYAIELSAQNQTQMYVPEGFAHGFLSLEDNTVFEYKCSNYYHPASERTIIWNDSNASINWPTANPIMAEKDVVGALEF
jgi:dTDP-4-dehydrorhamnose 3,5-epimerase